VISTESVTVKARQAPRDAADLFICLVVGSLQLLVLFALPCFVVFMATSSALIAGFGFLVVYAIFLSISVWSLELTTDGIRFARFLGSPRFIPWNQISTVKRVPRSELILHGWLWPPFPAREMTASLSRRDHFRIQYATGFRYFPPNDPEHFEAVIPAPWRIKCQGSEAARMTPEDGALGARRM
jgi:hypothetical protein